MYEKQNGFNSNVNIDKGKAWTAIDWLSTIRKSDLSDKIKQEICQAVVVSLLLYGCTTWTFMNRMEKKARGKLHKVTTCSLEQIPGVAPKVTATELPHGVMAKALDCGIVVNEFELQSLYYVHWAKFSANISLVTFDRLTPQIAIALIIMCEAWLNERPARLCNIKNKLKAKITAAFTNLNKEIVEKACRRFRSCVGRVSSK